MAEYKDKFYVRSGSNVTRCSMYENKSDLKNVTVPGWAVVKNGSKNLYLALTSYGDLEWGSKCCAAQDKAMYRVIEKSLIKPEPTIADTYGIGIAYKKGKYDSCFKVAYGNGNEVPDTDNISKMFPFSAMKKVTKSISKVGGGTMDVDCLFIPKLYFWNTGTFTTGTLKGYTQYMMINKEIKDSKGNSICHIAPSFVNANNGIYITLETFTADEIYYPSSNIDMHAFSIYDLGLLQRLITTEKKSTVNYHGLNMNIELPIGGIEVEITPDKVLSHVYGGVTNLDKNSNHWRDVPPLQYLIASPHSVPRLANKPLNNFSYVDGVFMPLFTSYTEGTDYSGGDITSFNPIVEYNFNGTVGNYIEFATKKSDNLYNLADLFLPTGRQGKEGEWSRPDAYNPGNNCEWDVDSFYRVRIDVPTGEKTVIGLNAGSRYQLVKKSKSLFGMIVGGDVSDSTYWVIVE